MTTRPVTLLFFLVLITAAVLSAGCRASESDIGSLAPLPTPRIPAKAPSINTLVKPGAGSIGILLMGSDKRPGIPGERSDALMYVLFSARKHRMLIISFPRDAYVSIPGRRTDRINAALTYGGPELAKTTVRSYLGLPVDYYVLADFSSFKRVVNRIGGVKVTLNSSLTDRSARADLPAGTSILDGAQALSLARARHSVPGGDFGRAANQQRIVVAAHKRFILEGPPLRFSDYVSLMTSEFRTDIPVPIALGIAHSLRTIPAGNVERLVLSGSNGRAGAASVVLLHNASARRIAEKAKRDFGIR